MLIVEELFLLLRRDDGRAQNAFVHNQFALTGGLLADLLVGGHIQVDDVRDPKLASPRPDSAGHPALDRALERLRSKSGKRLSQIVFDRRLNPEETVGQALADAGVVRIEHKRMLGLVPARYPVLDPRPERDVRERLRLVIAGGPATPQDAALLALLSALDVASRVLAEEKGELSRRELKDRIEEVAPDHVAAGAVRRALQMLQAATA